MKFFDKIKSLFKKDKKDETNLNQTQSMDNCCCNDCSCSDVKVEPVVETKQENIVTPTHVEANSECCSSCDCGSYENNDNNSSN